MGTWEDFTALSAIDQGERALVVMREVVAEFGEGYCLPEGEVCRYVDVDENGAATRALCLIGHIVSRLGLPLASMVGLRNGTSITGPELEWATPLHWSTRELMGQAQLVQDGVLPVDGSRAWGPALARAEEFWRVNRERLA